MKSLNKTTGIILISLCFVSMVSTDLIVHAESSDEKAKMTPEQQHDLQAIFSENAWSLTSEQRVAAQDSYRQFQDYRQFEEESFRSSGVGRAAMILPRPSIRKLVVPKDPFTIQNRAVIRGGEK